MATTPSPDSAPSNAGFFPGSFFQPKRSSSRQPYDEPKNAQPATRVSRASSVHSGSRVRFNVVGKPAPRSKTTFRLAHPPPSNKNKQRLRIRPRLLLQLHQLSEHSRSFPALDVLPSTIFAPRLASRFPRVFRGRDGLGPNDLVVVSSESYDENHAEATAQADDSSCSSEDETWENRDVAATICQFRKEDGGNFGKAEICLNHGSSWEATPMANGSYEFNSVDANGNPVKARWVLRTKKNHSSSNLTAVDPSQSDDKRFTFSIINPTTRRHPVIASMTNVGIEVLDQYSTNASSPNSPSNSRPSSPSAARHSYFDTFDNQLPDQSLVETDEHLRTLVVVTGIWVVFREGWSKNFIYNDAMSSAPLKTASTQKPRPRITSRSNTSSLVEDVEPDTPSSPGPRTPLSPGINPKRLSGPFSRKPTIQITPVPDNSTDPGRVSIRRTHSAGAAYLEKVNRRHASNVKKQTTRQFLDEQEEGGHSSDQKESSPSHPDSNSKSSSRLRRMCPGRHDSHSQESDSTVKDEQEPPPNVNVKERTNSSATTLLGLGDMDRALNGGSGGHKEKGMTGSSKEQDSTRDTTTQGMVQNEKLQPEKPGKKQNRRWSFRGLAHAVSCR